MSAKAANEKQGKPGLFARIGRYFRDMKGEVKKVVWPAKKQIVNNTAVVIVTVIIAAIVIGGFDFVVSALVNLLFTGA